MAVGTYALTTLVNLKSFMNITVSDNDTLLENCIDRATGYFETYTRRKLKARDYSYDSDAAAYDADNAIMDGNDQDQMVIPQYPLNSLTTLRINETEIEARSGVYSLGYILDKAGGIIRLSGYLFTKGLANIELAYNAGYSTVPDDLEQAAIEHAAWLFKQSTPGSSLLGISSKSLADGTVSYSAKEILPEVRMVLEQYKKRFAL
nr:hypothetical protein 5 [bacterium]